MIIDAHAHVTRRAWDQHGAQWFRNNGVDVIVGFISNFTGCPSPGRPEFWREQNREVAQVARESGGTIVPFCTVHPRDGKDAETEVRRAVTQDGMRGIKLQPHPGAYPVFSPEVSRVAAVAGELGIPVFFHCCFQPYVTPAQIGLLARELPRTIFILGHGGWNNEWQIVIPVAKRYGNVYVCTAGVNFGATREIVKSCDPDRIVFGSDFPCGTPTTQLYEMNKIREIGLDRRTESKILGENTARLLGL